jgi:hypothetical protein
MLKREECDRRGEIGVGQIMWGSDYPHLEGTHPYTSALLRNTFAGVPTDEVAMMLGGNAASIYGFDIDALDRRAADVGPLVTDVATPLDAVPAGAPVSKFR